MRNRKYLNKQLCLQILKHTYCFNYMKDSSLIILFGSATGMMNLEQLDWDNAFRIVRY